MSTTQTITFNGIIFEYELDENGIIYIKEQITEDGITSFVSIGQPIPLNSKSVDNIEKNAIDLVISYLNVKYKI